MSKTFDDNGTTLKYLLGKIKAAFVSKTDVESVQEVRVDTTPTTNSQALVTSGGVKSALDANDAKAVHTTGTETIRGSKTFEDKPILDNGLQVTGITSLLTGAADQIDVEPLWDENAEGGEGNALKLQGDSGNVRLNGIRTPSESNDAVNKEYVDDVAVHKTGDESIAGNKTFDDVIIIQDLSSIQSDAEGKNLEQAFDEKADDDKVVKIVAQSLESQYQKQARKNISASADCWGVVSQTQIWASDYSGYTMSDQVWGGIPQMFVDLCTDKGAVFNSESGYFELNGLTDISYSEMRKIYNNGDLVDTMITNKYGAFGGMWDGTNWIAPRGTRTFFNSPSVDYLQNSNINCFGLLNHNNDIEVCPLQKYGDSIYCITLTNMGSVFLNASHLTYIGYFTPNVSSAITMNGLSALKSLYMKGLKTNATIKNSPFLSNESMLFVIKYAQNGTTNITITLHADAYARASADTDIQTALTNNGHITLASA